MFAQWANYNKMSQLWFKILKRVLSSLFSHNSHWTLLGFLLITAHNRHVLIKQSSVKVNKAAVQTQSICLTLDNVMCELYKNYVL